MLPHAVERRIAAGPTIQKATLTQIKEQFARYEQNFGNLSLEAAMAEPRIDDPSWLRDQAAHCRYLARRAKSQDTVQELLEFAEEYDADAAHLEGEASAAKRPSASRNI